jgi:two-component system NtrC family sensor kinase
MSPLPWQRIGHPHPRQRYGHSARGVQPFFTTKPAGEGTGLGLSMTHDIIVKHGGRIDVAADGQFTEFIVTLPRTMSTQS